MLYWNEIINDLAKILTKYERMPSLKWVSGFFQGKKLPKRDTDISSHSTVQVKNEWSCTSNPPICFHGVDREYFYFLLLIRNGNFMY
jgi:hypothetical protein